MRHPGFSCAGRPNARAASAANRSWLASVFSTRFIEEVKFALNRADLRSESHEQLSEDLSEHVFAVELLQEYLENGWTTANSLVPLILEYNASLTRIRKREFVYRARVAKYWNREAQAELTKTIILVRRIDGTIHELNDELEEVNIKKSKSKIDPERAQQAADKIKRDATELRKSLDQLLGV